MPLSVLACTADAPHLQHSPRVSATYHGLVSYFTCFALSILTHVSAAWSPPRLDIYSDVSYICYSQPYSVISLFSTHSTPFSQRSTNFRDAGGGQRKLCLRPTRTLSRHTSTEYVFLSPFVIDVVVPVENQSVHTRAESA